MTKLEYDDQPEEGEETEDVRERQASKEAPTPNKQSAAHYERSPPISYDDLDAPPLPDEEPPDEESPDDGWAAVWNEAAGAYFFYNRFTHVTQWDNPRVPAAPNVPGSSSAIDPESHDGAASSTTSPPETSSPPKRSVAGGYNPAIHGDYDPNADYALEAQASEDEREATQAPDPNAIYAASGAFNRHTGKWQNSALTPENFNDENKARRQMYAIFDVDAAANSHDGRSLKEERKNKRLTKDEVKAFRAKNRAKKEEKRRAWLRE